MKVNCKNCKTIYDTKDGKYEDHEAGKCTWTNEDKKDYHYSFLSMIIILGGLFGGFIIVMHTNNIFMLIVVALPTLVIGMVIQYRVWTPTTKHLGGCGE